MEELTAFDTEIIEHAIMRTEREISDLERELERLRVLNVNRQAELRRRELGAFWQAHPGLRLEVGDGLLVTEEYLDWYKSRNKETSLFDKGEHAPITNLEPQYDDGVNITCLGMHLGDIALSIARRMREAYLQAHGEVQS